MSWLNELIDPEKTLIRYHNLGHLFSPPGSFGTGGGAVACGTTEL